VQATVLASRVDGPCHCLLNPDDLIIIRVGPDGLVGPTSSRRSISDLRGASGT
jgi:hypothetical protein